MEVLESNIYSQNSDIIKQLLTVLMGMSQMHVLNILSNWIFSLDYNLVKKEIKLNKKLG